MKKYLILIPSFWAVFAFSQEAEIRDENPVMYKKDTYEKGLIEERLIGMFKEIEGISNIYEKEPSFPKNEYTGNFKYDLEVFYNKISIWIEQNKTSYPKAYEALETFVG